MSSAPLSSKKNLFVQNQGHYSTPTPSVTGNTNPNLFRRSLVSSPSASSATSTTLIRGPKPFYRSRVTPDPFDYSNSIRRQSDSSDYAQPSSQRRYSVNQLNGTWKSSCWDLDKNRKRKEWHEMKALFVHHYGIDWSMAHANLSEDESYAISRQVASVGVFYP